MEVKRDILDEIELRSEGVQDILTRPPHWMIRWGNTLIFIILLLILLMSYIIKYPEFVPSQVVISTQNPPEKLESRINSKIEALFVKDHQVVTKGQQLLILQSTARYQDVLKLKVVEEGSHTELVALQGEYYRLVKNQLELGN
ncbi:biotin/lipoyl-binding protein [Elizabethkingia anophelis]